jgi:hypothetical protein
MYRRSALLIALLLACDSPTRSNVSLVAATDRPTYVLATDSSVATVDLWVENTGRLTLEIPRCGSQLAVFIDGRAGSGWQLLWQRGTICPAIYPMTPLSLAPGERARSPITLPSGTYRVRVPHAIAGRPADDHTAASNAFTISDAP